MKIFHVRWLVAQVVVVRFELGFSMSAFAQYWPNGVNHTVISNGGYSCPIRLVDPFGGSLERHSYVLTDLPYKKTGLVVLSMSFECMSSDDVDSIRRFVFSKYDKHRQRWEPDFSGVSLDDLALIEPITKRFGLTTINSSGVGVTQDAVNGDPETWDQAFGFCLRHRPVTLCGSVLAVARPYHSKVGLMPYALTLINSIEFVSIEPEEK